MAFGNRAATAEKPPRRGLFGGRRDKRVTGLGRGVEDVAEAGAVEDRDMGGVPQPIVIEAQAEALPASAMVGDRDDVAEAEAAVRKPTRADRKAARAAAKGGRGRMSERDSQKAAAEDKRISNAVMIEFYPDLSKEDAITTARNWAMTHMDVPAMCYYYIQKIAGGYAVEVQEGVGRAYLPSALELAMASPGRLVVVPMIRRKMTVHYSSRMGEYEAQVLPEGVEPPSMEENPPVLAKRSSAMTPVMRQHLEWLYAGIGTAVVGGLALISSLAFFALDPKSVVPPEWRTTDVAQLPVMQWGRLQADATDSYVVRLEYQEGQWRITRQSVAGSTVEVAPPPAADGSVPAAPGADAAASPTGVQAGAAPAGQQAPTIPTAPSDIPPPSN